MLVGFVSQRVLSSPSDEVLTCHSNRTRCYVFTILTPAQTSQRCSLQAMLRQVTMKAPSSAASPRKAGLHSCGEMMRMLQRPLKLYNAALHCLPLKADILYLGRLVSCVVFAASPAPGRGPEAANPNTQPAALQIRRRPRHFQIKDFCGCRLCASHVYKTSGAVGA